MEETQKQKTRDVLIQEEVLKQTTIRTLEELKPLNDKRIQLNVKLFEEVEICYSQYLL